ncbi:hypothetical protein [Streptomyces flaveus]|uniref:hypothetical protein n=1 Tax=Streptomyces flaveus TaxID=66370 RepID=UPI0033263390
MATYPGTPLTVAELPEDLGPLDLFGTADVEFGTDRIGAYWLLPPSDPDLCDADSEPATAPSATPVPWGSNHP